MRVSGTLLWIGLVVLGACDGDDKVVRPPQDVDGDGYDENDDCDDDDAAISPAAEEICDGVDNDCDGSVDGGATDAVTWYPDNDGDGYGSDRVPGQTACDDPSSGGTSYSADPSDCDDADDLVSPAAAEDCSDGVDNDCDGVSDGCSDNARVGLDDADAKVLGASGDGAGTAVAGVGDVNGDGLDDLLVGAPTATVESRERGAAWLVLGGASGEVEAAAATARLLGVEEGDEAGAAVGGGDLDLDGFSDLVVSAPGGDPDDVSAAGAVYVEYGPVTGERSLDTADARLIGKVMEDGCGAALAVVPNVGSSEAADLWIGEPQNGDAVGRAYLVLGAPYGELNVRAQDGRIDGEASGDQLGSAVSGAGDLDGDGKEDLAVGAPGASEAGTRAGRAYLVLDSLRDAISGADADARLEGEGEGDQAGYAVAGVGDLDGDGYSEVLVGAYGDDDGGADAGAAYLVSGDTRGSVSLSASRAKLLGPDAGSYAGFSVAGPGDVNADGTPDLMVGVPYDSSSGDAAGAAYVVYGPVSGSLDLGGADAEILGEDSTDQAGRAVAGGGDADGDGRADLLVGSPLDRDGGSDAGAAWLVLGLHL